MIPVRHFRETIGWDLFYWTVLMTLAGLITLLLAIKSAAG